MAVGRPVITTNVPGCRETVNVGENGFIVEPGDVYGLAGAMLRLVDDPALARRMGTASRRIARERFDGHETATRIALEAGL
jgi:glycosyltransferase involved in cell wall biosynthesis